MSPSLAQLMSWAQRLFMSWLQRFDDTSPGATKVAGVVAGDVAEALQQQTNRMVTGDEQRLLPPRVFSRAMRAKRASNSSRVGDMFGAGTDGVLRYRGNYYMEVTRKSVHGCVGGVAKANGKCHGGFGRETDMLGFYHFVATIGVNSRRHTNGTGIFLQLGMPVMDYTCPSWVVHAARNFTELSMRPTWHKWKWNQTADNVFNRPLRIKCVNGWCTPAAACLEAKHGAFDPWAPGERVNQPAYWKADPPVYEHRLRARGFKTTIVYWAGHDAKTLKQCVAEHSCEYTSKVLVDTRRYGVDDSAYHNGTHKIACPPGHFYHVAQNREMRHCDCVENRPFLNCQQLSLGAGDGGVPHWKAHP